MKNNTVGVDHEDLKVVRPGTISGINSVAGGLVRPGITGIWLADDVAIAADVAISERREQWFLRERPGPQAIAGTSRLTIDMSQHVYPEDQPVLFLGGPLGLFQRCVPFDLTAEHVHVPSSLLPADYCVGCHGSLHCDCVCQNEKHAQ